MQEFRGNDSGPLLPAEKIEDKQHATDNEKSKQDTRQEHLQRFLAQERDLLCIVDTQEYQHAYGYGKYQAVEYDPEVEEFL